MPYPRSLDEIPSRELVEELARRLGRYRDGRCPYCLTPFPAESDRTKCKCRFGDNLRLYHSLEDCRRLLAFLLPG